TRFLETQRTASEPAPADVHGAYLALVHTLGTRTGELHQALAARSGDPAFDPEAIDPAELTQWRLRVRDEAESTLARLQRDLPRLADDALPLAERVLAAKQELLARIDAAAPSELQAVLIRYHGDYP